MRRQFPKRGKNRDLLIDFTQYCANHPDERFWQALRNWAEVDAIYIQNYLEPKENLEFKSTDTFYFEGRDK